MTSKEALEKLCKVKIYQKEASAYDYLGKEIYKEEINTIKQNLESLEALNKVWHDNEPMESVDINGKHLQELYNYINKLQQENEILKMTVNDTYDSVNDIIFELQEIGSNLKQENEKLKKALATIKEHVQFIIKPIESNDPVLEGVYHFGIKVDGKYGYYTTLYKDEAIPLKEVLGNE